MKYSNKFLCLNCSENNKFERIFEEIIFYTSNLNKIINEKIKSSNFIIQNNVTKYSLSFLSFFSSYFLSSSYFILFYFYLIGLYRYFNI